MAATRFAIFDLDGTLADTAPDIAWALGVTLDEAGIRPPPLDDVKTMIGDGGRALIGRAVERAGAACDVDALLVRFLVHYRRHLCVGTAVYPGVVAALDRLRRAGVGCAVVTNKPGQLARELLERLGIATRFVAVIGDGDGYPRKPDPTGALAVLGRAEVPAERSAVVGDGLADAGLARALGCRAVAAAWGYTPRERLAAESPDVIAVDAAEAADAVLGQLTTSDAEPGS
jgi:phosphoglycolate phosphatase